MNTFNTELQKLVSHNKTTIAEYENLKKQLQTIQFSDDEYQKLMKRVLSLQKTIVQNEILIKEKEFELLEAKHKYEKLIEASKIKHLRDMAELEQEREEFIQTTPERNAAIRNAVAVPSFYSFSPIKCRTPCQLYRRKDGNRFESNSMIEDEKHITCYTCKGDEFYGCKSNELGGWSYCEPYKAEKQTKRKRSQWSPEISKRRKEYSLPTSEQLSPSSERRSPKQRKKISPSSERRFTSSERRSTSSERRSWSSERRSPKQRKKISPSSERTQLNEFSNKINETPKQKGNQSPPLNDRNKSPSSRKKNQRNKLSISISSDEEGQILDSPRQN